MNESGKILVLSTVGSLTLLSLSIPLLLGYGAAMSFGIFLTVIAGVSFIFMTLVAILT